MWREQGISWYRPAFWRVRSAADRAPRRQASSKSFWRCSRHWPARTACQRRSLDHRVPSQSELSINAIPPSPIIYHQLIELHAIRHNNLQHIHSECVDWRVYNVNSYIDIQTLHQWLSQTLMLNNLPQHGSFCWLWNCSKLVKRHTSVHAGWCVRRFKVPTWPTLKYNIRVLLEASNNVQNAGNACNVYTTSQTFDFCHFPIVQYRLSTATRFKLGPHSL